MKPFHQAGAFSPMQTIIMIPGLGSDGAVWRRTIAALGSDNAACTSGDTLSDPTLPKMAQRILAQAPPRFALAGVSMGGMVAMEIVKLAPDRVTRLALVDTNARPDTLAQKAYRRAANLAVGVGDYRALAERSLPSLLHPDAPQDVRDEMVEMSVRVGPKAYVRQNRAVTARKDLRPVLATIAVPTTVIVGEEDRLTPVELSQEIHALTPGSTLHVIPGCGHLPPIEAPDAMAALLTEWMARS